MEKRKSAAALRYDAKKDEAPVIVANGLGVIAENIIATAKANQVPIYEDAALANQLAHLERGYQIPYELYDVVAQVLVFISHLDKGDYHE